MAADVSSTALANSVQAGDVTFGGEDNGAGNGQDGQIASSDVYDPAQDVSLSGPSVLPDSASHLPSASVDTPFAPATTNDALTGVVDNQAATSNFANVTPTTGAAASSTPSETKLQNQSAARSRIPHDTIGILEDRTKEDQKGDMEAWLSLIDEYKQRGKIDEIRKVYDRFFSVFPQAVSTDAILWDCH